MKGEVLGTNRVSESHKTPLQPWGRSLAQRGGEEVWRRSDSNKQSWFMKDGFWQADLIKTSSNTSREWSVCSQMKLCSNKGTTGSFGVGLCLGGNGAERQLGEEWGREMCRIGKSTQQWPGRLRDSSWRACVLCQVAWGQFCSMPGAG